MAKTSSKKDGVTIIKKYANRRLYDTGRSSYVTLDDLSEMVRDGYEFVVQDAKSGEDLTRSVLAQIILDQESNNEGEGTLLPTNFMRQLIGFYGGAMQPVVPDYLESSMKLFEKNQERIQDQINQSIQGMSTIPGMQPAQTMLEEINKQNMAMMERTMKLWGSFPNLSGDDEDK